MFRKCSGIAVLTSMVNSHPELCKTEMHPFFFGGGMGLTPLGTPPTMTHHTYSDDFQELLPLFIHWMGGLFLSRISIL